MDRFRQTKRRVRFNLPDPVPNLQKDGKIHGTSYINGTLINNSISRPDETIRIIQPVPVRIPIVVTQTQSCLKQPRIYIEQSQSLPEISGYYNRIGPTTNDNKIQTKYATISSTRQLKPLLLNDLKNRHIVVLNSAPPPKYKPKMQDNATICERFSRIRLFDEMFHKNKNKTNYQEIPKPTSPPPTSSRPEKSVSFNIKQDKATTMRNIKKNLFSSDQNIVADLIQRWHRIRYKDDANFKKIESNCNGNRSRSNSYGEIIGTRQGDSTIAAPVSIRKRSIIDVKSKCIFVQYFVLK